jgi:hypothetical protein
MFFHFTPRRCLRSIRQFGLDPRFSVAGSPRLYYADASSAGRVGRICRVRHGVAPGGLAMLAMNGIPGMQEFFSERGIYCSHRVVPRGWLVLALSGFRLDVALLRWDDGATLEDVLRECL